ncbi:MAG: hypothetical protein QOG43_2584 [Actinomycetota bacterium]|jgi:hypothetical protein|nr:hypothetical protein [Actinomycetota bacterium]
MGCGRVRGLVITAGLLALAGSWVASARLDARFRNPDGIPISHPRLEPVSGVSFDFFTSRSPDGTFSTVLRQTLYASPADVTLLVVDAGSGDVVGRFPSPRSGGRLDDIGWRDASTLWVSVVEFPATCVAAAVASPPAWEFVPDDCGNRPADAGATRLPLRAPSPDGLLTASARDDRSGPWDFGDGAPPVPDVRIDDRDGRFLAQLGNLTLGGWTRDGTLIVISDSDRRTYAISRAEIDRIVAGGPRWKGPSRTLGGGGNRSAARCAPGASSVIVEA